MVATGGVWRATLEPTSVVARAGETVRVELCVDNPGDEALLIRPRWMGVDPEDVTGLALFEVPARAKVRIHQDLRIAAAGGAARRTLAVELNEAGGDDRLLTLEAVTGTPDGLQVWTEPANARGRLRAKTVIHAVNQTDRARTVDVRATASDRDETVPLRTVSVPAGGEVTVPLVVRRPPHGSRDERHAVVRVDAQGDGAAAHAVFTFVQRGLVPALGRKAIALVVLLGLWAGVLSGGITLTRKLDLTGEQAAKEKEQAEAAEILARTDEAAGAAGADGAAAGGAAAGGDAAAEDTTGGDGGDGVEISGKVEASGKSAEGIVVRLRPVQIADDAAAAPDGKRTPQPADPAVAPGPADPADPTATQRPVTVTAANRVEEAATSFTAAQPTVIRSAGDRSLAKRWSEALVAEPSALGDTRTTTTDVDGAWGFADVPVPGVFELLFAAPGFTSKSFLVTTADPTKPVLLDVKLAPGDGSLGGRVSGPGGPMGGVEVSVTDGVVTYHTTTATEGDIGAWSLPVVGTPARYVVTFTRRGYGTETLAVDLGTGASQTALAAALVPGVGSIAGKVHIGELALGNVTVTATNGTVTRTTTTLTEGAPGTFLLPQLPIPGTYTVTVTRTGFVSQSLTVELTGATDALDIALVPASALIFGRITEAGVDPPVGVAGVGIDVTDGTNVYKSTTALSPAGVFELGGLPPGTYTVTFSRFEFETASSLITVGAGERRQVTLSLTRRAQASVPQNAKLSGVVYSAANGQPLDGAVVQVQTVAPFPTATVGANGSFSFENLPIGTFKVVFNGPANAQHQPVERTIRLGTATEERLEVTLVPLGSLAGHLTDSLGRAIANADVIALTDGGVAIPTASARTAQNGDYNIQAVLSSGAYKVRFEKSGFEPRTLSFNALVGDTVRVDAQLTSQPRIRGRILTPQGSPVTTFGGLGSIPVSLTQLNGSNNVSVTTDASGTFEFTPQQLQAGTWRLTAVPAGPNPAYLQNETTLAVTAGDDVTVELVLSPVTSVGGTAYWVNANGSQVPVGNLVVRAINAITGWEQTATGAQNPLRATLNAAVTGGNWTVSGHVAEAATYELSGDAVSSTTQAITVVPGTPTATQHIELQPNRGSIIGHVATDPANLQAGHTVTLTAAPSNLQLATQTDANGDYRFDNLRPGTYQVVASNSPSWITSAPQSVTLASGAAPLPTAVATDLTLQKRSSITVTVAHSSAGFVDGATVQLWDGAGTTMLRSSTPSGHSATFDLLDPGSYQVKVQRSGFKSPAASPVTVSTPGADHPVTLTLTPWSVLSGTVHGTRAGATAPLQGAAVTVTLVGTATQWQLTTAANGTWSLPDLDSGSYSVAVAASGYTPPATQTVTVTVGTNLGNVDATLSSLYADFGATVNTDANDTPLADVTVTATGTVDGQPHTATCTTDLAAVTANLAHCEDASGDHPAGVFYFRGFDATSVHLLVDAADHHELELDATLNPGAQTLPTITLLGNAGSIAGTVQWAPSTMTGSPQAYLEGATVVLTKLNNNSTVEVDRRTTPVGGTYAFSALAKGKYRVTVSAGSAYGTANSAQLTIDGQETRTVDPITLVANNRNVVLTITSSPGGASLGGATVSLTGAPRPSATPVTDSGGTGTVTIANVPPYIAGTGYQVQITKAGHESVTFALTVEPGTGDVALSRSLNRFATISGTVSANPTSQHATVRAGSVTLTPATGPALHATPNASTGAYSFTDLTPGSYTLSYAAVTGFVTPPSAPVTVAWGDTAAAGTATFKQHATVTVTLSGSGATGRTFTVSPEAQGSTGPYSTAKVLKLLPDVDYTFSVAAGANVNAAASLGPRTYNPGATATETITVTGEGTAVVTLKDNAGVTIALDDPDTPADEGETPTLSSGGTPVTYTVQGDTMRVAELPAGSYTYTVDGVTDRFASSVAVAIGSGDATASATMYRKGILEGTLVRKEDNSVKVDGVEVCLAVGLCTTTDVDGRYRFESLAAGSYTVSTAVHGSCPATTGKHFTVLSTSEYTDTTDVHKLLTEATFTVELTVDGAPLAANDAPTLAINSGYPGWQFTKVATGQYTATKVGAGSVTVTASMGNGANLRSASAPVTVGTCATGLATVNLDLVAPTP